MSNKKNDLRLCWEATRTCGMFMAMQFYQINVQFRYEFWVYSILTNKYMKDIMMYNQAMNNTKNYFVKEKKE